MAIPIHELTTYVPAFVARRIAGSPAPLSEPLEERFTGALLFADISGFTTLAERLAKGGPSGAEQLTVLLNAYFERVMELILGHGGDVVKMAGDALIALWTPSDAGETLATATLRAARCGLVVQENLGEFSALGGDRLSLRVGLGAGEVTARHLGGFYGRWDLMIAGPPLVQMGAAEHQARPGDVVLSPEAWALVEGACSGHPLEGGAARLEAVHRAPDPCPLTVPTAPPEAEAALRSYFPGAILARLNAGQKAWLAELRRVTVLFVNLPDLGDPRPEALGPTQQTFRALQEELYRYEGSVNKLSVDEKGASLVAAMGLPPLAHVDDATRGVQAAQAMRARLRDLGVRGSIGVATGRVYCGEIGGPRRREYTMIGDIVNLSARLMQAAAGGILCDAATQQAARARLLFEGLPPIAVKGKADPVAIFRPLGQAPPRADARRMIGRLRERLNLAGRLDALRAGTGGLVSIEGEAGIGKSRLIADLLEQAQSKGVACLIGGGDAIENATPYHAWRPVFARLLDVEGMADPDARRARVLERLQSDPELAALAPLLDAVLPLDLPEGPITAQMVGKVRADNLNDLLIRLLRREAARAPTALILEDAHWLDSASWALAHLCAQRVDPVLLVVSSRPMTEPPPPEHGRLLGMPGMQRIVLDALPQEAVAALVCQRLGVASLPMAVETLIAQEARGNPFFSEEMAYCLRDAGTIVVEGGECRIAAGLDPASITFPDSLQGVITGRIDRLPPPQQMALKVASVIGRSFPFRLLHDVHPIETDKAQLPGDLAELERAEMTLLDTPEPGLSYLFKHLITQETCYSTMLYAQRRQLHRAVAEWYEAGRSGPAPVPALLAHHWGRAGIEVLEMEYLARAGADALRGGAHHEAVRSLSRAAELHDRLLGTTASAGDRLLRAHWGRQLGEGLVRLGRLPEAEGHLEQSLALLGRPAPRVTWKVALDMVAQILVQVAHRLRSAGQAAGRVADEEAGDRPGMVAALCFEKLAFVKYFESDILRGLDRALAGLNAAEVEGHSAALARSYAGMGVVVGLLRCHRGAQFYARRAEEVARKTGNLSAISYVLIANGVYYLGVGKWEEARACGDECVAVSRRLGDLGRLADGLTLHAMRKCYLAEYAASKAFFEDVEAVGRRSDNPLHRAWGECGRGEALFRLGRTEEGIVALESALRHLAGNHDRTEEVRAHGLLAVAHWRLGRRELAREAAEATTRLVSEGSAPTSSTLEGYAGAAVVYLRHWEAGDPTAGGAAAAVRACAQMHQYAKVFPIGVPRDQLLRGLACWLTGLRRRAVSCWRRSLAEGQRLGLPLEVGLAHLELGRHLDPGDPARRLHLAAACQTFEALGAHHELGLARAELRESPASPV